MRTTLARHLEAWSGADAQRRDIAVTVSALTDACATIARLIALGPLAGEHGAVVGGNIGGDKQTALDLESDRLILEALRSAPVAAFASEEADEAVALRPDARLAVAVDPLDGSSNIDTNVSIGTIFGILPVTPGEHASVDAIFTQSGERQLAAGIVVYGPQTSLVLTLRDGTDVFTLDPRSGEFALTRERAMIPAGKREYAINASNYRHWDPAIQAYVDDCIAGADGPRGSDFNMRWVASLVAEAFRILARGGVFLYPGDRRPGYERGRLRLVYEANPLALLVEQAGGLATNGMERILDLVPTALHQRTPLVFGCAAKVERVTAYCSGKLPVHDQSPLFGRRGLFRA